MGVWRRRRVRVRGLGLEGRGGWGSLVGGEGWVDRGRMGLGVGIGGEGGRGVVALDRGVGLGRWGCRVGSGGGERGFRRVLLVLAELVLADLEEEVTGEEEEGIDTESYVVSMYVYDAIASVRQ